MQNNNTNFIFEAGTLANTQRSGLAHLGMGRQNIAEHSFRTTCISHLLSTYYPEADLSKVFLMSLYHDFHESRTGDLNALHKKYCTADEVSAINDSFSDLPMGLEIKTALTEKSENESIEAIIVKDADTLEWIAFLVEQKWNGSKKADFWIERTAPRLKTKIAKQICQDLINANPDDWWKKILEKKC